MAPTATPTSFSTFDLEALRRHGPGGQPLSLDQLPLVPLPGLWGFDEDSLSEGALPAELKEFIEERSDVFGESVDTPEELRQLLQMLHQGEGGTALPKLDAPQNADFSSIGNMDMIAMLIDYLANFHREDPGRASMPPRGRDLGQLSGGRSHGGGGGSHGAHGSHGSHSHGGGSSHGAHDHAGHSHAGHTHGGSGGGGGAPPAAIPSGPVPGLPEGLGPVTPGQNGVPAGLKPNAARGAAVVREVFDFQGDIGGLGHRTNKSDHPHGNAIDVMTRDDMQLGQEIADYFREHNEALGVKYVIFNQRIASPRTGWQWEPMEDRGGPTANHLDHPHISFYGPE